MATDPELTERLQHITEALAADPLNTELAREQDRLELLLHGEDAEDIFDIAPDDDSPSKHVRRAALIARVTAALTIEWQSVDDIVEIAQGRRLSEFDLRHAAVRKVLARMRWPESYHDTRALQRTVDVTLPDDRVFGQVRRRA